MKHRCQMEPVRLSSAWSIQYDADGNFASYSYSGGSGVVAYRYGPYIQNPDALACLQCGNLEFLPKPGSSQPKPELSVQAMTEGLRDLLIEMERV